MYADAALRQNIILQLGLQKLPESRRLQIIESLVELAERRILIRLLEELPDSAMDAARALKAKPVELLKFLAAQVPNAMRLMQQEVEMVRSEALLAANPDGPIED